MHKISGLCRVILIPVLAATLGHGTSSGGELVLFDFEDDFRLTSVGPNDVKVSRTESGAGRALRISTGHRQEWPGVTLVAPSRSWNLAQFGLVTLEVKNLDTNEVTVHCRLDNPGADGSNHCVSGFLMLKGGASGTLKVSLQRTSGDTMGGKLFGMRGYPAGGDKDMFDPVRVTQLVIFVSKPATDHLFEVDNICAGGSRTRPTASTGDADPFYPLIDTFGQYRHRSWPGKIHSLAELTQRREDEAAQLATNGGPAGWNTFGGWENGPKLEATGFFRVEKYGGKWWLIDPEGRLFWSHGIDCVGMKDATVIEERESWFENFPGTDAEFAEFVVWKAFALKGHYAGQRPKCFSFAGANLRRKYGVEWNELVPDVIHHRLRSWGLNTIGNWSDEAIRLRRRTAYTDAIGSRGSKDVEGSQGYWGKFPDVFDPSFSQAIRESMAAKRQTSAGDPWCIGYFSDNELSWGDETSLAVATLRSPPLQEAKRTFVAELKAKYGKIGKLNAAWGTTHGSWEGLLQNREAPNVEKARGDLTAFYSRAAEQYFRTVRDAIKEVAPGQLYLGCRFAWGNGWAAAAAAKYCDVVSYNLYHRSVADFEFNGGTDVPLIIGEFHFGALDRGMFHTGLVPVSNQAERAGAYKSYVEGALKHPQFVGCHWFQYKDQPTTGRVYDEENYQIGFVNIADTPYAETIAASQAVGSQLYALRLDNK